MAESQTIPATALTRPPTNRELAFLRARRVGRLATIGADGFPALVPICYDVMGSGDDLVIVSALDEKPKRVPPRELNRVLNILRDSRVGLVVDDYNENWSLLGFVQLRGVAHLIEPEEASHTAAVSALRAKYPQYGAMRLEEQPLIQVERLIARSWTAEENSASDAGRPTALEELIRGRRSVRNFGARPVSPEQIAALIDAAGWAPSPHGRQPWRFAIVTDPSERAGLAEAMAATWRAQLELDGQDASIVEIRLNKSRQRLCNAPVLIVPCLYLHELDVYDDAARQEAEATMAIQSLGAAIQNLLLTAYASGLDAGWMCAPLFCPDIVRGALELDSTLIPHAILIIGYAAQDPVRRPRRPSEDLIVSWR
ncbi:MAG: TIGR03668 family PPOX class F420-dependent oxidoreductase [Chloroflexota bacterium]|nr:TIGR03668 family PPOX class F420-dependent oxidoreductase [Chloroflexota bacterium]